MTNKSYLAAMLALSLIVSAPAFAMCPMPDGDQPADHMMEHSSHDMGHGSDHQMQHQMSAKKDIYASAMDKMMANMPEAVGDADADYMRGMIVHHQAAVDMSNTALQKAQNPQLRALADTIITAQKSEIAYMREWLRMHDFSQPK